MAGTMCTAIGGQKLFLFLDVACSGISYIRFLWLDSGGTRVVHEGYTCHREENRAETGPVRSGTQLRARCKFNDQLRSEFPNDVRL